MGKQISTSMKNKLPFIIVLLLFFAFPQNVKAYDFSYTYQGKTLFYTIIELQEVLVAQVDNPFSSDYYSYVTGNLVIPDSVEYNGTKYAVAVIGSQAFVNCSGLNSVTIGNSVISIGPFAFKNCSGLTSLTIPNSVTSIGTSAFYECSGLTSVTIPNSVIIIENSAFYGCTGLTSATIGNSVTRIGEDAFYGCTGLTSMTIPNSVSIIGYQAFWDCTGLTSVTIGNSVTIINGNAFGNCIGLTSVTIPNSVTTIQDGAFYGCSGLTSVTIPSSVTYISFSAFSNCSGLTSLVVDEGNIHYDSRDNCNAIIETALNRLVLGCNTTIIPNSITAIGNSAFSNCSGLTSLTIPNSVTFIGGYAFSGCDGLTSVYCMSVTPPTVGYNYFALTTNAMIYVPCGSVSAYQSAICWSDYSSRIFGMPNFDHNYEFLPNNETMGTVNVGAIDCDSNITVTAIPNTGYHFVEWSDGGTENPRTFHLTSDTNVTAIFSNSVTSCQLTVIPNDATMGSVTGSGSYPYGTEVTVTATPAQGYRFDHWSDNSTQANYTFILTDNLQLVAFFMPEDNGNDTVYVPIYIHDTITITDTLWQTQYVHDTTVVTIHDSVVVNHYYHDTTFVHDYIHDTVMSYINHYVHDTTFVNNYVHDTVWMSSHVFDTTIVNIYQFDTTMVNLNIFDTTIVNNYIFDTVFISNYYYDTVHVHDTVYITQEGINGVDALNAKVYSSQGQIVVEGANGNMVTLYDVTGRTLISKQDEYTPLHFDAPASGTYLIKIGNHPARKVVVIR